MASTVAARSARLGIGAHPLEDRNEEFGVQIALEADEVIGERRIFRLRRLSVRIEQGVPAA